MQQTHQAVMLNEAIAGLNIQPGGVYIDATYGRGGHARAILAQLTAQGRLLVLDKDPQAINDAQNLAKVEPRLTVLAGSFKQLSNLCEQEGVTGKVNGILFDLGVSSPQLDEAERGFSFMRDGPLDMRMDPTSGISVADWLATATAAEIAQVLKVFGEERFSMRIANAIVAARQEQAITTTKQLADLIAQAIPFREQNKHPATRSFQALRIFINQELEDLSATLAQVINLLADEGRLVVISFHSLEDRIVKQFMAKQAKGDNHPRLLPIMHEQIKPKLRLVGKAIMPSEQEITQNVRARSAVLRIAAKVAESADE